MTGWKEPPQPHGPWPETYKPFIPVDFAGSPPQERAIWLAFLVASLGGMAYLAAIGASVTAFTAYVLALVLALRFVEDSGDHILPYFVHLIIPITVYWAAHQGGWVTLYPFLYILVLIPAFDHFVGYSERNHTPSE